MTNKSDDVIRDFGREWQSYTQDDLPEEELSAGFESYFGIVDFNALPPGSVAADIGSGSGRWAKFVAPRVGTLHCVEPSEAIEVARRKLAGAPNVLHHRADIDGMPISDGTLDFLYCLGVLHHVPDTLAGLRACVAKLKPGGRILVYIYYRFDDQPMWFKALWRVSDVMRRGICRLPYGAKLAVTRVIALTVYWPLSRLARVAERQGADVTNFPLSGYRNSSFYSLQTDALDRFGTRLEQRFTRDEIRAMFSACGLEGTTFSPNKPYWCATAVKRG